MPMPRTIDEARRAAAAESKNAKAVAAQQEAAMKAGYSRSPGFDAPSRSRKPYVPEADRPLPPSPPLVSKTPDDPNVKIEVGPDGVVRRTRR